VDFLFSDFLDPPPTHTQTQMSWILNEVLSIRYNKQFIAWWFGRYEDFFIHEKSYSPRALSSGEYDFSWMNKSSYLPHYYAINVYTYATADVSYRSVILYLHVHQIRLSLSQFYPILTRKPALIRPIAVYLSTYSGKVKNRLGWWRTIWKKWHNFENAVRLLN
jgi:hypothetical protein